jgi:hypothetical protein
MQRLRILGGSDMTVSFTAMAALRSQADDLIRQAATMSTAADDMAVSIAARAKPLAAPLEAASRISDDVFGSLRAHSRQFASHEPVDLGRLVPQATRDAGVAKLDEAIRLMDDGVQGIDDALGAGTWMSQSVRESRAFHAEARRVMADPTLGPDSADHAIDLLRQNGWAYDEAGRVLKQGNVDGMLDMRTAREIEAATPEALEEAARWRTVFGPPPVA